MANNKQGIYDMLVIPTGETTFGDYSFPVTNKAIELFKTGKYGGIFITGGYSGFATKKRKNGISEGKETYDYILKKGINPDKVFYDDQSLESIGKFTFPIVYPMANPSTLKENPSLLDFNNMQIIAKEGPISRVKDYANIVLPEKYIGGKIDFISVPEKHNNGISAKVYHAGIMKALNDYIVKDKDNHTSRAKKTYDFLIKYHPFYLDDWYDFPVLERKFIMAITGLGWRAGLK